MTRKRTAQIVTGTYTFTAALVFLQFLFSPADGLANIWIAVWTLPVALAGILLLYLPFDIAFPFVPSSGALGHYWSHAIYFVSAVAAIAALIYRLIAGRSR